MSTKVPIYLKRGSRKGKKEKLRDILSSDMISPPLGDFRHTIHVGSGGRSDTFGDISFLQGKFHLLPHAEAAAAPCELARAAAVSGPEAAAAPSPLLKNAISLPALGGARALTLPPAQAPPKPPRLHLDEAAAAAAAAAVSSVSSVSPVSVSSVSPVSPVSVSSVSPVSPERGRANGEAEALASHAGSLLSLHVDLGPSILDEVLQVMERHQAERQLLT